MMTQPSLFDPPTKAENLAEGLRRRDDGIETVSRDWDDWLSQARKTALRVAAERGSVCSDDIHENCPLPSGAHPNLMGAVFRGIGLTHVGWTHTTRPTGHGRTIRVYAVAPS